ncbi:MAG: PEP-CTERM sorting domain-containing protein [Burkholderiales bacterium]|nr:PEP-CTERM sorting domain-containing protein [Burkholderiales bacterium]
MAIRSIVLATGAVLALATVSVQAATVLPVSYDTPNGDGRAHGGSYNYWDLAYDGNGSTTTDRAALTGGLGDLTDGVIATQNWNQVENSSGTGPYVGWREMDPTLTFHYNQTVHLTSITLYADDADGLGAVYAPGGLTLNGTTYSFADPLGLAPNTFTVSGLDVTAQDFTFTINRRFPASWTFVSEITTTAAAVPEPSTTALALLGLTSLGLGYRKRNPKAPG